MTSSVRNIQSKLAQEKRMVSIDMAGNVKDLMNLYQQMRQNPMQMLSRRFNIPQNVDTNNPNDIIQYLLNSGQVTQSQVNQAMQARNNPFFKQFFN